VESISKVNFSPEKEREAGSRERELEVSKCTTASGSPLTASG
jgi:hypothetical protein